MRKLASVQKIGKIISITEHDCIVQAIVNGKSLIVRKNEFNEGDLCVFFEINSILPKCNILEHVFKYVGRIKTYHIAGVLSQGLVINIDVAKCIASELGTKFPSNLNIGMDLTDVLKVKNKRHRYTKRYAEPEGNFEKLINFFKDAFGIERPGNRYYPWSDN